MKPPKISLFKMATHDFWRSLRAWKGEIEPKQFIEMLTQQRHKALAKASRGFLIAGAASLWICNAKTNSTVALQLLSMNLQIPVVYVVFAIAFQMMTSMTAIISYFHINEFLRLAVNKYYAFENNAALVVPFDSSNTWSMPVLLQFRFLKSSNFHKTLIGFSLFGVLLPTFVVLVFIHGTIISNSLTVIATEYYSALNIVLAFTSIFLVAYPILYTILIVVPFKFTKNVTFTRWNFLSGKVHRRQMTNHPRLHGWLKDGTNN
jgi:hypothetical protein